MRLRRAKEVRLSDEEAARILSGMDPGMTVRLARLAGQSLDELDITLLLWPYGDRVVLAAYDLIELGTDASVSPRHLKTRPALIDVINLAAFITLSVAEKHLDEVETAVQNSDRRSISPDGRS